MTELINLQIRILEMLMDEDVIIAYWDEIDWD
jgi:hypothetical protein